MGPLQLEVVIGTKGVYFAYNSIKHITTAHEKVYTHVRRARARARDERRTGTRAR